MDIDAVVVEYDGSLRFEDLGVRMRFVDAPEGRLEPVGVELLNTVLSLRALQAIPFGRLEAVANTSLVAKLVQERMREPGPHSNVMVDLREPAAYGPGQSGWIKYQPADDPDAPLVTIDKGVSRDTAETVAKKIIAAEPTRYGDEFYQLVAQLYEWEATRSGRPGAALAERLDVPVGRIWRWVRVCRSKGYLAPSRSGKET